MRVRTWIAVLAVAGGLAGAATADAHLDIEHTASTEILVAGAVVEFTITARNSGEDTIGTGRVVVSLSPGLAIPAGTAPFYTQGSFDPVSGYWTLGDLRPGEHATLSFHAQVAPEPLPACEFSWARLQAPGMPPGAYYWTGQGAFAALRQPGVTHCVNLVVMEVWDSRFWCSASVTLNLRVANHGPDPARQVRVTVSQQPKVLPNLEFEFPSCPGSTECVLEVLGPGQDTVLWLRSDEFNNSNARSVTVEASLSSSGTELYPAGTSARRMLSIAPFEKCDFDPGGSVGAVGCFIATAAYGSPLHPHVEALRRFRDRFLLSHAPGRALVAAYYRASPPVAAYIAARPAARALARAVLAPLVLAAAYPGSVLGILAGLLLAWSWRRRRRRSVPFPRPSACPTTRMDDIPRRVR
jgi:hypothetical protein